MSTAGRPFGGEVFIVDKSVWARSDKPAIRDEWEQALRGGHVVTCDVNRLEILHSARTANEFAQLDEELGALRNIPTTRAVWETAFAALNELAQRSNGYHRVSPPDVPIAASAHVAGVDVLHYDHHFDRLAEVLVFQSLWVAEAGSLD